jgi:hypothetical protein
LVDASSRIACAPSERFGILYLFPTIEAGSEQPAPEYGQGETKDYNQSFHCRGAPQYKGYFRKVPGSEQWFDRLDLTGLTFAKNTLRKVTIGLGEI